MSRLIAIGDIHGCSIALDALLKEIDPTPEDLIVTLGDYVDRGPDSAGVIDLLIDLRRKTRLVPIMGNHEEMMLDVLDQQMPYMQWLPHGGVQTLESYDFDGDLDFLPDDHAAFYDSMGDFYEEDHFFFTHAAYDPALPLTSQSIEALRWTSIAAGPPPPHPSGKVAVVGHTASREGEIADYGHLICLDTYCYGGGWLTAMDVRTRTVHQSTQEGETRTWQA